MTRQGKRTNQGVFDDGLNSAKRYFINNFNDHRYQQALDIILGSSVSVKLSEKMKILREQMIPSFKKMNKFEEEIYKFYEKYNPKKVNDVPQILKSYKGKEKELLSKLNMKYVNEISLPVLNTLADTNKMKTELNRKSFKPVKSLKKKLKKNRNQLNKNVIHIIQNKEISIEDSLSVPLSVTAAASIDIPQQDIFENITYPFENIDDVFADLIGSIKRSLLHPGHERELEE